MKELLIENTITINAPANIVWDLLTNPEKTKMYMFGCEALSTWNVGDELIWKGNYEGKEMVFVTGNIVSINTNKKLVYTTFDPNSSIENIPVNYLTVSYELFEENNHTTLVVTQGDYNKVAEGERRFKESYNNGQGWNPILVDIKKLAELM